MSNHTHHHNHTHNHVHTNNKKILTISFIIIGLFMIVEILGGFIANSLALLSDGLHMFSDTVSLGVALIAFIYAEKNATSTKTFGYKRFEVLAALFNGITLLIISGVIIIEAIRRFFNPIKVQSTEMFIISVIGLIVNIIVAIIMFKSGDTSHNLNMRGAFIHVLGDLLGSLGAIIASILIYVFNFTIADPIASILVSIIILKSAIGISNDMNALSCHAVVSETMSVQDCEGLLKKIEHELLHLNIQHMTIQLETAQHDHDTSVLCSGLHKEHTHH